MASWMASSYSHSGRSHHEERTPAPRCCCSCSRGGNRPHPPPRPTTSLRFSKVTTLSLSISLPFNTNITKKKTVIQTCHELIDRHPPSTQSQRFGNKSFRDWYVVEFPRVSILASLESIIQVRIRLEFHSVLEQGTLLLFFSIPR